MEKDSDSSDDNIDICIPLELTYAAELRDMIAGSYKELGRSIEWHFLPVNRCVKMVNEGLLDADIGRNPIVVEKYSNLIVVPVQIFSANIDLYSLQKVNMPVPDAPTLLGDKSLTVGYPQGVLVVNNMLNNDKSIGARNSEQLISLLRKERVDFILLPQVESQRLKKEGSLLEGLHLVKEGYIKIPAFHVLNRKHEALAADLAKLFRNRMNSRGLSPR